MTVKFINWSMIDLEHGEELTVDYFNLDFWCGGVTDVNFNRRKSNLSMAE